jgi:cysteinyl-tRNA synthetase
MHAESDKEQLDTTEVDLNTSPLVLLKNAKSWAYQLQEIEIDGSVDAIVNSKYDVVVLEPTRTCKGNEDFDTKEMVQKIKSSTGGNSKDRKLVFAYINIGEAEDWRWYWKWDMNNKNSQPSYIIGSDPEGWEGNFPVAFWDKNWKDIVIYGSEQTMADGYSSLLDEALLDGFDGVYLDWVEGYNEEMVKERGKKDGVIPKKEMVKLLRELRKYSKERNKDFMIIQQNASDIYKGFLEVFQYIDAIAQEAIWYDGTSFDDWNDPTGADISQSYDLSNYYVKNLKKYLEKQKIVFNVEYADKYKNEAIKLSMDNGFIPYCSKRPLSKLSD